MNRRMLPAVLAMIVMVSLLSGCANSSEDLSDAAATSMQSEVVKVADAAATGNYASAASQLDALQTRLTTATAANQVSASRALRIQSSIDLVRADLAALAVPSSPSPTPTPSHTEKGHKPGKGDGSSDGNND